VAREERSAACGARSRFLSHRLTLVSLNEVLSSRRVFSRVASSSTLYPVVAAAALPAHGFWRLAFVPSGTKIQMMNYIAPRLHPGIACVAIPDLA
jgi:hypothetical protein